MPKDPNSANIARQLAQYDKFNRSTDDTQSHRVRYDLLQQTFQDLLRTSP
jgi:hypothetical protein